MKYFFIYGGLGGIGGCLLNIPIIYIVGSNYVPLLLWMMVCIVFLIIGVLMK